MCNMQLTNSCVGAVKIHLDITTELAILLKAYLVIQLNEEYVTGFGKTHQLRTKIIT